MAFKEVKLLLLGTFVTQKPVLVNLPEQIEGFPSQQAWHHSTVGFRKLLPEGLGSKEPALLF